MKSPRLISVGAPMLALLLFAGCAGTPVGPGTPAAFPTRDLKPVGLSTGTASFIVSLNDDDDNDNQVADLRQVLVPATDDNIRELVFHHPTADAVYVADIIDLTTHQSVVGVKVRAYEADLQTPFAFNASHPTSVANPLKLCLEGIKASGRKDEFGFEYAYYLNGQPLPSGGFVVGTVTDVNAALVVAKGGGSAFADNRKMLITSAGRATGSIAPAGVGPTEWTYDAPHVALATPLALVTDVTADTTVTAALDQDQLRFKVQATGHWIEAHFPINVTAPQHTRITNARNGFTIPTGWIDANKGQFSLFPVYRIDYELLDQFNAPIKQSAYGDRVPQIRENIGRVMTSPMQPVRDWITNSLQWSPNWINKPGGKFTDRIEATGMNKAMLIVPDPNIAGRRMFDPGLQANGGVLLSLTGPHIWELSVNGAGIVSGTTNSFSSTVSATRAQGGGIQIQLTSTYQANPQ